MRVMVAMSGGVDSSVAAAILHEEGHEVVGVTLKLWGGPSDSGCCSVADVEDARRVAQQIGIDHHVFNLTEDFERTVVAPYVAAHEAGKTPNPCVECNRRVKFGRLLERAERLGFEALATGHHARVAGSPPGSPGEGGYRLLRGVDPAKDQSYVLSMLGQGQLARLRLPVGEMTKDEVRRAAASRGLRTATKPDSQDVCFVARSEGRQGFLAKRMDLHEGVVVDGASGEVLGTVPAVELVTVGQRRGIGAPPPPRTGPGPLPPGAERRYVTGVDVARRTVTVAGAAAARVGRVALAAGTVTWVGDPVAPSCAVLVQTSAHGLPRPAVLEASGDTWALALTEPAPPVAPGQTVALYDAHDGARVLGAGIAA